MSWIGLYDYQIEAIKQLRNGSILCGGVGSGKSRTALAYYYIRQGGVVGASEYVPLAEPIKDLYIITTARKRDTKEWEAEMAPFLLGEYSELYHNQVVVDSWNNIQKYKDVKDAFFIFDEQRVVGNGAWVKSFLKIAKCNEWILLSATPGDTWMDYVPVFVANGYFKNRTQFYEDHVVRDPSVKFFRVSRYLNTGRLLRYRNAILVNMDYLKQTVSHHEDVYVSYDTSMYKRLIRTRWNPWTNEPIKNASEYCYLLRRIVNVDESRQAALLDIVAEHPRAIIFYNFDYELEILRNLGYGPDIVVAEWSGHKHEQIPTTAKWVYLVQYTAGAEGWNCISTDTIIFYSQNYSYKVMVQSAGRIDRVNTPFRDLYFFHLKSRSGIDLAISQALSKKKKFNEQSFVDSR